MSLVFNRNVMVERTFSVVCSLPKTTSLKYARVLSYLLGFMKAEIEKKQLSLELASWENTSHPYYNNMLLPTESVAIMLCVGVDYRLSGSSVERQGRLEVRRNGVWGTVCDDGFTDTEAQVACYSLGYG